MPRNATQVLRRGAVAAPDDRKGTPILPQRVSVEVPGEDAEDADFAAMDWSPPVGSGARSKRRSGRQVATPKRRRVDETRSSTVQRMSMTIRTEEKRDRRQLSDGVASTPRRSEGSDLGVQTIVLAESGVTRSRSPSCVVRPPAEPIGEPTETVASAAYPLAAAVPQPFSMVSTAVGPSVPRVNCALSYDGGASAVPSTSTSGESTTTGDSVGDESTVTYAVATTGDSVGDEIVLNRAVATDSADGEFMRAMGRGPTYADAVTTGASVREGLKCADTANNDDSVHNELACSVAATTVDSHEDVQAQLEVSASESRRTGEASGEFAATLVKANGGYAVMPEREEGTVTPLEALNVSVTSDEAVTADAPSPVVSSIGTTGEAELNAVVDDLFRGVADDEPLPESWLRELAQQREEISANLRQQCTELREVHRRIQVTESALQGMLYRMERVNEFTGQTLIAVVQAGEAVERKTQEMRLVEQAVHRTGACFLAQQRKEAERLERQNVNAAHLLRLHRRVTDAHGWWLENQGSAVSALLSPYEEAPTGEATRHVHWRREVMEREERRSSAGQEPPSKGVAEERSSGEAAKTALAPSGQASSQAAWQGPAASLTSPPRVVTVKVPLPTAPEKGPPGKLEAAVQPRATLDRRVPTGVGMDAYDGVSSLERFLDRFTEMAIADGWTDEQAAGRLPYYLPPYGVELVMGIDASRATAFDQMRQKLLRHYGEGTSARGLLIQLDNRGQARGEGLVAYAKALLILASRAYPTMDREQRVAFVGRLFVAGLRDPGLAKRVQCANPDSLEQAIAKALELQGGGTQETALEAWERAQRQFRDLRERQAEGIYAAQAARGGRTPVVGSTAVTSPRGILREPRDTDRHLYGTRVYIRDVSRSPSRPVKGTEEAKVPAKAGNGPWFGEKPRLGAGPASIVRH